jgi:bacillithiol biosynthesis cysteine-adding enzyme BshC
LSKSFQSAYIPFSQTEKFTKIVLDYIAEATELQPFYEHFVNLEGIKSAIAQRKKFKTNRKLLVEQFEVQYKEFENIDSIKANIQGLLSENTFTICTAHQPNLFTGHLYFIYKILHTIKIADTLKKELPEYNFVPVFFMGSEDADFEELNHVVIDGQKHEWQTQQSGAVGRMKVDDNLIKLIDQIAGRLSVEKFGNEIIDLLKRCFMKNSTIEQATFLLVHALFKEFGLLVLLPDSAILKNEMLSIFEDDILNHTSSKIVEETSQKLALNYKAQAYPREINLFYLKDNLRNRIVPDGNNFQVFDTDIIFTREEILQELKTHPERFSPNVILRGLFQEFILPDVAWIGGGGELAYWLQLKELFTHFEVPYPVLVVRNSFLIVEEKYQKILSKLKLNSIDLFKGQSTLWNEIVNRESENKLQLTDLKLEVQHIYERIQSQASLIDVTLAQHTKALEAKSLKKLDSLEKKMLRAEKRKYAAQNNQLSKVFSELFPNGGLQERTENFMLFYAKWGADFLKVFYENSLSLEQEFCIIEEK